jgi:hypothetical protein
MADGRARGPFLTTMTVLLGLLTVSNFTKVFQHLGDPQTLGIVVFGTRFESVLANAIIGPVMGIVTGAYAYGLWTLRRWVAPLSIAYAFYVPANIALFWYRQTGADVPPLGFIIGYLVIALGGSIGTALYLAYHPEKLR